MKILILMSTYNGNKYIEEQLNSIYNQKGLNDADIELIIRDDGSTDSTVEIIRKWEDIINIRLEIGENIGARNSFLSLLYKYSCNADFYAFCDQDDIWDDNKLVNSINAIGQLNNCLYFSNVRILEDDSRMSGNHLLSNDFKLNLKRILMCNPANGCTMVWDNEMNSTLRRMSAERFTMHDEYVCTIAYLFGNVIYNPIPSMNYRIHNNNETQSNSIRKKIKIWKQIWFERENYSLEKRAKELLQYELKPKDKDIIKKIYEYKKIENRFVLPFEFSCENRNITRSFRIRMILGLL